MFKPTITASDLWSGVTQDVGGFYHHKLLDLIAALRSPRDQELLYLLKGGCTQEEIALITGSSQPSVSERFRRILNRAR